MPSATPAILALAASLAAWQPASLREAVDAARRNAPQVGESEAMLDAARARASMALRDVLPTGDVFAAHLRTYLGAEPDLDRPSTRRNQVGVSVGVPLFLPEGWARSRSATLSLQAAFREREERDALLALAAGSAWVEFVTVARRLEIARARTASSLRSFEGVAVRAGSGDLTRIDLRQAESALFNAQASEAGFRLDSSRAAEAVFLLCGAYPATGSSFPDSLLDLSPTSSEGIPEASDAAAARLLVRSAAASERAALFGCFPELRLSEVSAFSTAEAAAEDRWEHRAELRLSVQVPPSIGAVRLARSARRIAESRHAVLVQESASRRRIAREGYARTRYALGLYMSDSAAAADVAAGREAAFLAGSATISEYLTAQKELHAACDALWEARRRVALAGLALLKESGTLVAAAGREGQP